MDLKILKSADIHKVKVSVAYWAVRMHAFSLLLPWSLNEPTWEYICNILCWKFFHNNEQSNTLFFCTIFSWNTSCKNLNKGLKALN